MGGVYLSSKSAAPQGFSAGSSLSRGSGYWAPGPDMPRARADHGMVLSDTTAEVYIMGGHDNRGNFLTR